MWVKFLFADQGSDLAYQFNAYTLRLTYVEKVANKIRVIHWFRFEIVTDSLFFVTRFLE